MIALETIQAFCDERLEIPGFPDFPGAENGLQVAKKGPVSKIGASVDAGEEAFNKARDEGVDFLIVHHGLFWEPLSPVTGPNYRKLQMLFDQDCAVYGAHLPLDAHPEIGNNALLAKALGLQNTGTFLPYEGKDIGWKGKGISSRTELRNQLQNLFPSGITAIEKGPEELGTIAILTGSGTSAVPFLPALGISTLVTGELKQNVYNTACENQLNLFCCGHYATETFGVTALAKECSEKFSLPFVFLPSSCPL